VIDTIVVPRGAEERAVRRALARGGRAIRVVATGIGARAAERDLREEFARAPIAGALATGLCGALSPAFAVGEALVYASVVGEATEAGTPGDAPLPLDVELARSLAARLAHAQSGVRALAVDRIVTAAAEKRALAERTRSDAVDMESLAIARFFASTGVPLAIVRVVSDDAGDELPAIDRALDGSGGIDDFAFALAMLRRPVAGARLARNGVRALRALERTIVTLVAP
jgi:adenosylhomocysteine nucleosidase